MDSCRNYIVGLVTRMEIKLTVDTLNESVHYDLCYRFKEQVNKAIRKRKTLKITNVLDKCKKLLNEKEDISSLLISIVEFLPE